MNDKLITDLTRKLLSREQLIEELEKSDARIAELEKHLNTIFKAYDDDDLEHCVVHLRWELEASNE